MQNRRLFLAGLIATSIAPLPTWADAGAPHLISAATRTDGTNVLVGISNQKIVFEIAVPSRAHAGTAHPSLPHLVVFARRPGNYALVVDCVRGKVAHQITAPKGHHFYGHGTYSVDGKTLFTTENAFENGEGRIGVWDAANGYRWLGSFSSGGTGPHDIKLMPDGNCLVIANGGIETHPDSGRAKLNIPTMAPNVSYVETGGKLVDQVEPPTNWHKNSMRHLSVRSDGLVAIGCQWQGDIAHSAPLLALHRMNLPLEFLNGPSGFEQDMGGYIGSVSFTGKGKTIGLTSPRGDQIGFFSSAGSFIGVQKLHDVCGAAPGQGINESSIIVSTGDGKICLARPDEIKRMCEHPYHMDNHLTAITT